MKFTLNDGTHVHLWGIVQTANYRRDYIGMPADAEEEIKRIAQLHLPPNCWRSAPLILITADQKKLNELMQSKKLPTIMCVGQFLTYRKRDDAKPKPIYFYVIWLQEEFAPHMSEENEMIFRQINWDNYLPKAQ
jgi:hypothetical protein